MSDEIHFMMGRFRAVIPTDRGYSSRHMWLKTIRSDVFRVGLTAYSVRLLQDVYFLEWTVDAPGAVQERQEIGEIESSKAVSALFAPVTGRILQFNEAVLNDPSLINVDHYHAGWLFDLQTSQSLLTAEQYRSLLEQSWDDTQRTIKGQMN